jgi:hypothetical protein
MLEQVIVVALLLEQLQEVILIVPMVSEEVFKT